MTTDFMQFRPRQPVLSTGMFAFCTSLLLHGVVIIWLVHSERTRLADIRFGPLLGGNLPELIELPDPAKQMLPIVQVPPEPPEPALGAPDGHGTSVDQTPGPQPQQARQADMEQPLLRLNPGFATNNQTGSLKGTDQPVFGTSPSGASPDDMSPAAAAAAHNAAEANKAQQQQARSARSPSVIASASAGSAPPSPKIDASKKPDAPGAQLHGQQQPRNPDALVGAPKQPTASPNAIRSTSPLQQQIALAGLSDANSGGDFSQARPGGPPDPHAAPDAQSARASSPPPQATAQSTGPHTDKSPTDDPNNATDPNAKADKAENSPTAQPTNPTPDPSPDAEASTDMDDGGATAARAAAPGDPAPRGRSDSDPFSTTADATFRDGREDVRLGFRYRITKPHILLKGWVDSNFLASRTLTLELVCDTKGNVISATVTKSSGSQDIDEPTRLEAYNWWFEPPKDAKGVPQQRAFPFTVKYYD